MDQLTALDWLRNASVGERTPNDVRLEYVAALALKELLWRHEKLCEVVMGILTDDAPERIGLDNAQYRQLLREQVSVALMGFKS